MEMRLVFFYHMKNYLAKLVLNPNQTNGNLQIFLSPTNDYLGQLLIISEIKDADEQNKKIVKQIIDETNTHYFNSIARDSEKALEDALQKVNFSLSETIKQTSKKWLKSSNTIIIALCKQDVHFSKIGKINAFLTSGKEITNIIEGCGEEEVNPVKIFANIYSGNIPDKAAIIFLTENILDYIAQDKLRKLAIENSTTAAMSQIEEILKKGPRDKSFGCLLIKRDKEEKTVEPAQTTPTIKSDDIATRPLGSADNDTAIIKDEPTTLAESIFVDKKEMASAPADEEESNENCENENSMITSIKTKKPKQPPGTGSKVARRVALVLGLSIIIVAAGVIVKVYWPNPEPVEPAPTPEPAPIENQFQTILNNVQAKFIEAQNLLLIDKKAEAGVALTAAAQLTETLPATTPDQVNQKTMLKKKVATQLLISQGIKLATPQLVADLVGLSPTQLILVGGNLYILNSTDGSIYQINPATKESAKKLKTASQGIGNLASFIDSSSNNLIAYHSLDGLAQVDLTSNKILPLEWIRGWTGAPITGDIYQNKLYVISASATLLKYTNSLTGFMQEVSWVKDPTQVNLSGAADMAIDGTVWILKDTGEIIKLFKGVKEDFAYSVTPPLVKPTRLYTDLDLKNLYLLDAGSQRIILLDKNGKIVNQLTAEDFTAIQDFAVDEANSKIYLLDGNKILEITF